MSRSADDTGRTWGNTTYALARLVVRAGLRLLFKMKITFQDDIPAAGPLVVVANHESYLDGFVVAAILKTRRPVFLSAPYLFSRPLVGPFLRQVGALPAYSAGTDAATLRTAIRILQDGGTVVVFPEGGISIHQVRGGAIFLAVKARASLLPMRITGTKEALPLGSVWPRLRSPVRVEVQKPIPASELCSPGEPTGVAVARGTELLIQLFGPAPPRFVL